MQSGTLPSRLLFCTLAVSTLGLFWLAILLPLSVWKSDTTRQIVDTRLELASLQQSLAAMVQERNALTLGGSEGMIWTAAQLGQVTALVQARVSELAKQHGLSLRSITPSQNRGIQSAGTVSFRLELEAPLDRLTDFLVALEYNSPALAVEQSTLRRLNRPGPVTEQPALFVQLDILAPIVIADAGVKP